MDIHGSSWNFRSFLYRTPGFLYFESYRNYRFEPEERREYVAKKIVCPLCERRILDIVTPTKECVIVRLKCPHCNVVVKVEIYLFVKDNIK